MHKMGRIPTLGQEIYTSTLKVTTELEIDLNQQQTETGMNFLLLKLLPPLGTSNL